MALMLSAALPMAKAYFTSFSISASLPLSPMATHCCGERIPAALEQTADAVGFMQARDNQIDKAKAAGDRLHDAVEPTRAVYQSAVGSRCPAG